MSKQPKPRSRTPNPFFKPEGDEIYLGQWILALGLNQAYVARESGVDKGFISRIVKGDPEANPTLDVLRRIAGVMGIKVQALFEPPPPRAAIEAARSALLPSQKSTRRG